MPMLVDQGTADQFLEKELLPQRFMDACKNKGYPVDYRSRPGYDHSYFFIASFIEEHLRFHAKHLQ